MLITFIVTFINKLIILLGMSIISMSINDKLLKDINKLQKDLGFTGRSEIIRAGLRTLISEEKVKTRLKGTIEGIIIVVNQEKHNDEVSKISHNYHDIIKTEIHNHLEEHKCSHVFVIKGNAEEIKKIITEMKISKKIQDVKLVIS